MKRGCAWHAGVLWAVLLCRAAAQDETLSRAAQLDAGGRCDEAEQLYRTLANGRQSAALLNNRGNHYLTCGAPEKARAAFEAVLRLNPAHGNANLQLARLAIESRKGAEALAYLDRIRQPDAAAKLARVEALALAGRKSAAAALAEEVSRESGRDARAQFALGISCGRSGLYAEAESAFQAVLTQVPADYEALYNLGLAAARAEHYERARQAFEVALRMQPREVNALFELGRMEANAGNYQRALLLLANARTLAPQRPDVLLALARAAQSAGFYGDAELIYGDYLKLRPQDELVRRDRAAVRGFSEASRAEATAELNAYVQRHPQDAVGYFDLAQITYHTDRALALEQVSKAVRLDPAFEPARYIRAWLLHRAGRDEEALADLQAAVRLNPRDALAFDQLGLTYLDLDRLAEAEKALRQAVAIAPAQPKALLHLARVLEDAGRPEEAKQYIEQFRKAQPDAPQRPREEAGLIAPLGLPASERTQMMLGQLRQRAAANPGDAGVKLNLGSLLLLEGRNEEAATVFRELLAMQPAASVCFTAGSRLLGREQYSLAREFLQRAAVEMPAARLELAMAVLPLDGADAALRVLKELPAGTDEGDRLLLQAKILDAKGDLEGTEGSLREARRFAISRPRLAEELALLAVRHGQAAMALSVVERAQKGAADDAGLQLTRALVMAELHRDAEAAKSVGAMEERWPEWDEPYVLEGLLLERAKKGDEARKRIGIALALGSREPAAVCAERRLAGDAAAGCGCGQGMYQALTPGCSGDAGHR